MSSISGANKKKDDDMVSRPKNSARLSKTDDDES